MSLYHVMNFHHLHLVQNYSSAHPTYPNHPVFSSLQSINILGGVLTTQLHISDES
jgi:hypothetical protein